MPHKLLDDALRAVAKDAELFGREGACPALFEPGAPSGRMLLITGENAGGKSLVSRYIGLVMGRGAEAKGTRLEYIRIGMDRRTAGGIERAIIFGDEQRESTGELTAHSVFGAIKTSKGRDSLHAVCFDEPDVGLSEGYQGAVGDVIAGFGAELPEHCAGLVVVTHSRPIAARLLALQPHCLRVGDDLRPTAEWLQHGPLPRSAADLAELRTRAHRRFSAISGLQARRQAEKRAATANPGPTGNPTPRQ